MAKGIDVDTFDTNGLTPLMWAVLRSQGPDTIRVLLALGADPNLTDRLGYPIKSISRSVVRHAVEKNRGFRSELDLISN